MTDPSIRLNPSRTLLKWMHQVMNAGGGIILDAPCGTGRNALTLAQFGARAHCVDIDEKALEKLATTASKLGLTNQISIQQANLLAGNDWLGSYSAIINIDWPRLELVPKFRECLQPDGLLFIETFGNRGENYRELPGANAYRNALQVFCDLLLYKEVKAGPPGTDAVTLKCLARKR